MFLVIFTADLVAMNESCTRLKMRQQKSKEYMNV